MITETLAPDVGWEPSGHLSEVALSVVADGEDGLLDEGMRIHLNGCDACAVKLGQVAMRAADVGEALGHVAAHTHELAALADPARVSGQVVRSREPRRLPMKAIAAALAVAVLGILPSLLAAPGQLAHGWSVVRKVAPSFVRLLAQAIERAWSGSHGVGMFVVWGLAMLLVATGFGIARRASKGALADGGRQ